MLVLPPQNPPTTYSFGYRPRGVNDVILTSEMSQKRLDLEKLHEDISVFITSKQKYMKECYDKMHACSKTFEDVLDTSLSELRVVTQKHERRFKGPFVVTMVRDHHRYVVDELPESKRSRKAYSGICPPYRMKLFAISSDNEEESSASEQFL